MESSDIGMAIFQHILDFWESTDCSMETNLQKEGSERFWRSWWLVQIFRFIFASQCQDKEGCVCVCRQPVYNMPCQMFMVHGRLWISSRLSKKLYCFIVVIFVIFGWIQRGVELTKLSKARKLQSMLIDVLWCCFSLTFPWQQDLAPFLLHRRGQDLKLIPKSLQTLKEQLETGHKKLTFKIFQAVKWFWAFAGP